MSLSASSSWSPQWWWWAVAGVFNDVGSAGSSLTHSFSLFGYHVTSYRPARYCLYGVVVGSRRARARPAPRPCTPGSRRRSSATAAN